MNELIISLLAWVALLSTSPKPATLPTVERIPHAKLEALACGAPCPVLGLYTYGDTVYLDEALDVDQDLYARSILLHELVHYAQERSGRFQDMDLCVAAIAREREAYAVQNEYLVRHGAHPRAGGSLHNVRCLVAAAPPSR